METKENITFEKYHFYCEEIRKKNLFSLKFTIKKEGATTINRLSTNKNHLLGYCHISN